MGAVVMAYIPLAAPYYRGDKLIKFSIPPYQENHILFLLQKHADHFFQLIFQRERIINSPVTKKGNSICARP